eukprot:TRINITY_DN63799_c0_g1_i1.p1 TRINITY_DN63799_c0_g1~~TRINITY_DN63799_c0_g1_i1.p1  ORF type:complete len:325 (+),score=35.42 TRINITY_DN63799_c0_g1_i1:33-977(+)
MPAQLCRRPFVPVISAIACLLAAHGLQPPYAGKRESPPAEAPGNSQNMPWRGKVAVIVRGQPFRGNRNEGSCKSECRESQLNVSLSVVSQLIEPLEKERYNSVDVFNVDCGDAPCRMSAEEDLVLSSSQERHVQSTFVDSSVSGGQAICVQRALDFFESSGDPSSYDVVMMIRHDVEWLDSIFSWSGANFEGFNFFSRCELGAFPHLYNGVDGPSACVNDILQVVPGRKYRAWREVIGKDRCFNAAWRRGHGHNCWSQTAAAVGGEEHVHLATPWVPKSWIREESTFARLKQCNDVAPQKVLHPELFGEFGAYK